MEENKTFYIHKEGKNIQANILTNFELYGDNYCIYTINKENDTSDVYCAKLINNSLVEIKNESERKRIEKIVKKLINN